jgi:hypothetical protein
MSPEPSYPSTGVGLRSVMPVTLTYQVARSHPPARRFERAMKVDDCSGENETHDRQSRYPNHSSIDQRLKRS